MEHQGQRRTNHVFMVGPQEHGMRHSTCAESNSNFSNLLMAKTVPSDPWKGETRDTEVVFIQIITSEITV